MKKELKTDDFTIYYRETNIEISTLLGIKHEIDISILDIEYFNKKTKKWHNISELPVFLQDTTLDKATKLIEKRG